MMDDLAIGDPVELEFIELDSEFDFNALVVGNSVPVQVQHFWVPATITSVNPSSFIAAIAGGTRYAIRRNGRRRWRKV